MKRAIRVAGAFVGLALAAPRALAADAPRETVADYEARLEEIAKEVSEIRRELEGLVGELSRGELNRVFVFLESRSPERIKTGVRVEVDGKTVFSRTLTPAETDALGRGLPLELVSLWLPAGSHQVVLSGLGEAGAGSQSFSLRPGGLVSWVAAVGASGVEWRSE